MSRKALKRRQQKRADTVHTQLHQQQLQQFSEQRKQWERHRQMMVLEMTLPLVMELALYWRD